MHEEFPAALLKLTHCLVVPENLKEIGDEAVWTLSSAKPGNGVEQLRDNNSETFWQSDGPQPHLITIQFHRKVKISEIWLCSVFKADESYTPSQISVRIGFGYFDLQEIQQVEVKEPDGWIRIPLCAFKDPARSCRRIPGVYFRDRSFGGAVDFIRTFCIQIAVLANHQNGRDTHIRQVKVFGPRNGLEGSYYPATPLIQPILRSDKLFPIQQSQQLR